MKKAQIVWEAILIIIKEPKYIFGGIIVALSVFGLLLFIPLVSIPGNSLQFQLSIMPRRDFIILTALSLLTGLAVMFHVYILSNHKKHKISQVGQLTFSGLMGVISSFFGTFTCIACAGTVVGFLGVGAVIFVAKYRFYIASIALALMMVSLYFTSLKVLNVCEECNDLQIKHK